MPWITRDHWFWGFLLPGRWYLFLATLGLACLLTFNTWGMIAGVLMLIMAGLGFSTIWIHWHSFTLLIAPGERMLWERRGLSMFSDRKINLQIVSSMLFRQTPMGRLLDYGNISLVAMGGPYEWENLGRFRTLRRIIESNGAWMPRPRIPVRHALRERFGLLISFVRQSWDWLLNWWRWRSDNISVSTLNRLEHAFYERFLYFAERFLFRQTALSFEASVQASGEALQGFTLLEHQVFWKILTLRHIVIIDTARGQIYRHPRIRSMQDVQNRIPAGWFDKYIRQY